MNYRLSKVNPKKTKLLNYSVGKNYFDHERADGRRFAEQGSSTPLSLQFSLTHSSFRSSTFPLARLRPDTLARIHMYRHTLASTCAHITRRATGGNIRVLYAGKYRSRKLCIGFAQDFMDFARGKQVAFERISQRLRGQQGRRRMRTNPSASRERTTFLDNKKGMERKRSLSKFMQRWSTRIYMRGILRNPTV